MFVEYIAVTRKQCTEIDRVSRFEKTNFLLPIYCEYHLAKKSSYMFFYTDTSF